MEVQPSSISLWERGAMPHPYHHTKTKLYKAAGQAPRALPALILLCALNAQVTDAMPFAQFVDLQRREEAAAHELAALAPTTTMIMLPVFIQGSGIFGGFAENGWHLDYNNKAPSDPEIDARIASYGNTLQLISGTCENVSPGQEALVPLLGQSMSAEMDE